MKATDDFFFGTEIIFHLLHRLKQEHQLTHLIHKVFSGFRLRAFVALVQQRRLSFSWNSCCLFLPLSVVCRSKVYFCFFFSSLRLFVRGSQYLHFFCVTLPSSCLLGCGSGHCRLISCLPACLICLLVCSLCLSDPLCLSTCLSLSHRLSISCLHPSASSIFIQLFFSLSGEWLRVSALRSTFIYPPASHKCSHTQTFLSSHLLADDRL